MTYFGKGFSWWAYENLLDLDQEMEKKFDSNLE